jgi:hypothetical protein
MGTFTAQEFHCEQDGLEIRRRGSCSNQLSAYTYTASALVKARVKGAAHSFASADERDRSSIEQDKLATIALEIYTRHQAGANGARRGARTASRIHSAGDARVKKRSGREEDEQEEDEEGVCRREADRFS